jgi:cobyric acid synthase
MLMARIGILKVRGAMPHYEELPFNIYVDRPGMIRDLDALIIPPGTLVESRVLERYGWLGREVWDFVERGGTVVGVCSGVQLLSKSINLNVRGLPGYVEGLGVLNISLEPLIVTGPVLVKVINESWATRGLVNTELGGWQAHTYGKINVLNNDVQIDGVSTITRYNYRNATLETPTLVSSRKYRVFGTMVHGILGPNSPISKNLFNELGIHDERIIREYYKLSDERAWAPREDAPRIPRIITVASTMTGEGKTLLTSALVHCLSREGYYVGVAKLGGDIRDLHPSLYVLKRPFKPWMSIMLRWDDEALGWVGWREALSNAAGLGLDYLVVEGVMGLLTGSSRDSEDVFSSTIGFIKQVGTDVILIASAAYDGVEGAIFRLRSYIKELIEIGRKPIIAVLNNMYHGTHEDEEVVRFRRELEGLSIRLMTIDALPISSKPEELIDLGDYEEAAVKISEESLCEHLIGSLGQS